MAKFKTRARTVDMLGRQQIAGIATAISELFKNSHDAYAENVEVDYFKSDSLFVLRDDGYGMTLEDFEDRWLTLGTESKLDIGHGLGSPYVPKGMKARPIMGEKGIGRLAIALIGPQVLVLTRAERNGRLYDLVAAFIHWGPFTIPGINLEDIDIPIRCFPEGKLPTQEDISKLVDQVKNNIKNLSANYPDIKSFGTILADLNSVRLDPVEIDKFLGGLSLLDSGNGTHLYIVPADEYLEAEIESEKRTEQRQFTNFLIGFSNQTFTDEDETGIQTVFRYWESDQDCENIIEDKEFFTKEDLKNADHYFRGVFDEYGQFNGSVRVYDQTTLDYVASWPASSGKMTLCGPFEIELGYVSGSLKESRLELNDWKPLDDKTEKIGGLYIYRNGLRILPYGLSDYDWLSLEERRTRGAGYYFFSYRRVFGAVKIDKARNRQLVEKAGREGFQENKAYRQFRDILINFFIQLAADFFRREANISTYYEEKRLELDRIEKARQKREKQATTKRRNFSESLENFFKTTEEGLAELEISNLNDFVSRQMRSASQIKNTDKASKALLDAEVTANRKLEKIRESFRITKPRGIGLTKQLRRDWDAYSGEFARLESEVFEPAVKRITETVGEAARQARIYVDQRRRLKRLLDNVAKETRRVVNKEVHDTTRTASETRSKVIRMTREAISEMNSTIERVNVEFGRQNLTDMANESVEKLREQLEAEIISVAQKSQELLGHVRSQLIDAVTFEADESGRVITKIDMDEALDEEVLALREQAELDADLAQLGMTIGIINHEFDAAIKTIRKGIRELKGWANVNDELDPLYRRIRTSFDHLDNYLNLFTPLQRRLYREPVDIIGYQIEKFLKELFENRLERHSVALNATKSFQEKSLSCYPSTFYPVFVNLIDNAIFWLRDRSNRREIQLDATQTSYLIKNSGPQIQPRDREAIFEQGFTRKPGGRGLGLFISRNVLRKEGYNLTLDEVSEEYPVIFIISERK